MDELTRRQENADMANFRERLDRYSQTMRAI